MNTIKLFAVLIALITLSSCNTNGVTNKELTSEVDSVSYAIGINMATQMRANFTEVDEDLFIQGFQNGLDSSSMKIDAAKANSIIRSYMMKKQVAEREKQQQEALKKAEVEFAEVKKAGEDFLAANKTKDGVLTTESGLQYKVLKAGSGAIPVATDKVKVHYHGTLLDGTVFDSSVERGTPYQTNLNAVIKGWIEGVQLMQVGSKYRFFVPQELAYGAFPRPGGKIRPFDALIFDLELLEIIEK
ncbi:MAG: FKBP-type peptidyl-prolyl cis-trans isomerase [Flavobacteriaceae bacterium]|nr:FKBP-type peptidyl-prolyl cis-trans isomerase [Flavobacteriaceae bacterium]